MRFLPEVKHLSGTTLWWYFANYPPNVGQGPGK